MKFVNDKEYNGTLYSREYLYHWFNRKVEFSYTRTYRVAMVSSKHYPKHRFNLRLYKLFIGLKVGEAPWDV